MLLIDPDFPQEEVLGEVKELFEEFDLSLTDEESWGLRTLAYPIDRHSQARYALLYLQSSKTDQLNAFLHELKVYDGILRQMITAIGGE